MFCSIWFANAQETVIQKKDLPKAAQEFLTKEYANNDWAIGKKLTEKGIRLEHILFQIKLLNM